jgi:hypothetical protein
MPLWAIRFANACVFRTSGSSRLRSSAAEATPDLLATPVSTNQM